MEIEVKVPEIKLMREKRGFHNLSVQHPEIRSTGMEMEFDVLFFHSWTSGVFYYKDKMKHGLTAKHFKNLLHVFYIIRHRVTFVKAVPRNLRVRFVLKFHCNILSNITCVILL